MPVDACWSCHSIRWAPRLRRSRRSWPRSPSARC